MERCKYCVCMVCNKKYILFAVGDLKAETERRIRMNILFVTPDYPKRGQPTTGFPNYLYRVSLSLIQLGHKPIILAVGTWDSYRIDQGIEIWTVRAPLYVNCKWQSVNYAVNALHIGYILNRKIYEMIKKMRIDVIQFTSLQGIAMLYYGDIPAVLRLSSYAKTAFPDFQTYSPTVVKLMSFFERCSAGRCNAVFSPSRKNAQIFGNDCHRKVNVIETPFLNDVQEYDNQYLDTCLKGKKYVLFFGTLYAEKGILVIAEILKKFLSDNTDYNFVFIGDVCNINGENAAQILRKKAGEYVARVSIFNAMPHKQLYPVIKQAEFVVLPSLMENLSNACIEAMYFERVVIGTDGASFEQLITHGKNGLLCQIGNSIDLLDKMQMAVSMTKEEKIQMGKMARRRIDRLKPEYAVKKLVELYAYVIKNNKHN